MKHAASASVQVTAPPLPATRGRHGDHAEAPGWPGPREHFSVFAQHHPGPQPEPGESGYDGAADGSGFADDAEFAGLAEATSLTELMPMVPPGTTAPPFRPARRPFAPAPVTPDTTAVPPAPAGPAHAAPPAPVAPPAPPAPAAPPAQILTPGQAHPATTPAAMPPAALPPAGQVPAGQGTPATGRRRAAVRSSDAGRSIFQRWGLPYLIAICGTIGSLAYLWRGPQNVKAGTIAVALMLLAAAAARLVLPERWAGLLASRRRLWDVAAFSILGFALLVAGLVLPAQT